MPRSTPRRKRAAQEEAQVDHEAHEPLKRSRRSLRSRTLTSGDDHVERQEIAEDETATVGPSLSIQEIKRKVQDLVGRNDGVELERYLLKLESDPRVGVIALAASVRESLLRQTYEAQRLESMMEYERQAYLGHVEEEEKLRLSSLRQVGKGKRAGREVSREHYLIGVDEVGVGPLAGPIVSCAVAFKYTALVDLLSQLVGIDDSKKLSVAKRESIAEVVKQDCVGFNYGIVTAKEVDAFNPLQGSLIAMKRAIEGLSISTLPSASIDILVDHHTIPDIQGMRQLSITKGDAKSVVIAAASILAKVYRDEYMTRLHEEYPQFCFDKNAGYGTKDHLDQLRKGVLCPEHRLSYGPVRQAHRRLMGLPPDVSPEKKTRAKSRSVSPSKGTDIRKMPTIGGVNAATGPTVASSSLFSMTWWTRLFSATVSSQQR